MKKSTRSTSNCTFAFCRRGIGNNTSIDWRRLLRWRAVPDMCERVWGNGIHFATAGNRERVECYAWFKIYWNRVISRDWMSVCLTVIQTMHIPRPSPQVWKNSMPAGSKCDWQCFNESLIHNSVGCFSHTAESHKILMKWKFVFGFCDELRRHGVVSSVLSLTLIGVLLTEILALDGE